MKRFLILPFLFLFSCAPAPIVTPSSVEPLIVARTAGVAFLQADMLACEGAAPLVIREVLPGQAVAEDVDLTLRWGVPMSLPEFVYEVGEDSLVVVYAKEIPHLFTVAEVQAIFSGQVRDWAALGEAEGQIEVWALMAQNEGAGLFAELVLDDRVLTPNAMLAASPADVVAAVVANPNAIGYLPASWLTGAVQAAELGVTQPVLAVSDTPLNAAAQDWVACMQGAN